MATTESLTYDQKLHKTQEIFEKLRSRQGFVIVAVKPNASYKRFEQITDWMGYPMPDGLVGRVTKKATEDEWREQYKIIQELHKLPKWKVSPGETYYRVKIEK